jgi:hypothetical protein
MNAINDALAPLGARVTQMPFTPERILARWAKSERLTSRYVPQLDRDLLRGCCGRRR